MSTLLRNNMTFCLTATIAVINFDLDHCWYLLVVGWNGMWRNSSPGFANLQTMTAVILQYACGWFFWRPPSLAHLRSLYYWLLLFNICPSYSAYCEIMEHRSAIGDPQQYAHFNVMPFLRSLSSAFYSSVFKCVAACDIPFLGTQKCLLLSDARLVLRTTLHIQVGVINVSSSNTMATCYALFAWLVWLSPNSAICRGTSRRNTVATYLSTKVQRRKLHRSLKRVTRSRLLSQRRS